MKKTYQNPTTKIISVQTTPMLVTSPGYGSTTEATSGNLSRDASDLWDDDEY